MQLRRTEPVERADDADSEVATETPTLGLEARAVHHDAARVVHAVRVADRANPVAVAADSGGRR